MRIWDCRIGIADCGFIAIDRVSSFFGTLDNYQFNFFVNLWFTDVYEDKFWRHYLK